MSKVIMVGCDLHDRSMFLKYAVGTQEPLQATYVNDVRGRLKMILELQEFAKKCKSKRIVFVYEASGLGFAINCMTKGSNAISLDAKSVAETIPILRINPLYTRTNLLIYVVTLVRSNSSLRCTTENLPTTVPNTLDTKQYIAAKGDNNSSNDPYRYGFREFTFDSSNQIARFATQ